MSLTNPHPRPESRAMYTIKDIPGKGKGLIATRLIPRGTRILSEQPVVRVPNAGNDTAKLEKLIREQVETLTPAQQQTFLSMYNLYKNEGEEPYLGIFRTNALPFGDDDGGICLDACRINHSCANNAQKGWNANIKRLTVHALRDIEEGEEITIYYLGLLNSRQERQEALRKKFGFTCTCSLCSLPHEKSEESDRRLSRILELDRLIGRAGLHGILANPLKSLRYVDEQIRLYQEHGPDDNGLPRAYFDAAQIVLAHGDLARGRIFAERAVLGKTLLSGDDSPSAFEYKRLLRDPSKHEIYGLSMKWKASPYEVPEELGADQFDEWLWRREKPQVPGQLADLRNRRKFPSFIGMPWEYYFEPAFYAPASRPPYQPRRLWIFLAEIESFFTLARLEMKLKDIDGNTVPLFFYTEGRGSELKPTLIQKGYTVAILCPQRHNFAFAEPGIRHEDPKDMKIFPLSLNSLLALSDGIQRFSNETNGTRVCHGCEKQAVNLQKCARCSLFWYCSKACQNVGWNEKGHKADCKHFKDQDLKGVLQFDWDKFDGRVGFPLKVEGV